LADNITKGYEEDLTKNKSPENVNSIIGILTTDIVNEFNDTVDKNVY